MSEGYSFQMFERSPSEPAFHLNENNQSTINSQQPINQQSAIGNQQSAIGNQQSAISNQHQQSAINHLV
jgi:hypothetical protein